MSRDEILTGTYDLVARDGLDALSMPVLARHLDVGVTSIYWYFRSKDELLVAVAERAAEDVFSRIDPTGDGAWDDELRRFFVAFRRELERVPVFLELFSLRPRFLLSRPSIFALLMPRVEREVGTLVQAGLPGLHAARCYNACSAYTRGFVTLAQGVRREAEEPEETVHARLLEAIGHLDPGDFPVLTALGELGPVTVLDDAAFEHGLDLLLDGLRAEIDQRAADRPV